MAGLAINTIHNIDCLIGLKLMAPESVDCIVTSPPYFGLRDYGHGDQIGLEQTPQDYIDSLLQVFAECHRVLKPEGTLWLNLGDSYAGSILPTDKHRLVEAVPFVMPTSYDNKPRSIDEPAPTIQASRRHHYIVNPSHGGHSTSTDQPCPVIIARQDKAPLYLVQVENGPVSIAVYADDSPFAIQIKQFMAVYGLVDIKMRMLRVHELLKIQGFPEGYELAGNQSDQKKFIGNSVVPLVVKCWIEALNDRIINQNFKVA